MAKSNKKKFWNNGWVVGTGTAILSVLLLRIIDSIADTKILNSIWTFIKNLFLQLGHFFSTKYSIPLWGLILLSFAGLALILLVTWISSLFQEKEIFDTSPPFLKYTSDIFDGILYKWEYIEDYYDRRKYNITNFVAYCPKDNCIILHNYCQICHTYYGQIKSEMELRVLVQHRVDNNLYSSQQVHLQ